MNTDPASLIRAVNTALFIERKIDVVPMYFTRNYKAHVAGNVPVLGHAPVCQFVTTVLRAFPALDVRLEILVTQGDRVAWQRTSSGVQRGSLQGFPACEREVVWRDMVTSRLNAGLIEEEWIVSDLAEQLLRARKKER